MIPLFEKQMQVVLKPTNKKLARRQYDSAKKKVKRDQQRQDESSVEKQCRLEIRREERPSQVQSPEISEMRRKIIKRSRC